MKTVYLHIGYFKTGTTAVQSYFWRNREALAERGVLYPKAGCLMRYGHLQLPASIFRAQGFNVPVWLPESPRPEDVWGVLRREIEISPCENVFLCNEHFCSFSQSHAHEPLIEELVPLLEGYEVKVVAYLRRVDAYLLSWYNQIVKMGSMTVPLARYARTLLDRRDHHLYHGRILDLFSKVVGPENVIVRLYDRSRLKGGDVVEDALDLFGLERAEFPDTPSNANTGVPLDSLNLRLLANVGAQADVAELDFQKNLSSLMDELSGTRLEKQERLDVGAMLDELWPHFSEIAERYNPDYLALYDDRQALQPKFDKVHRGLPDERERQLVASAVGMLLKENKQLKLKLNQLQASNERMHAEMVRQSASINEMAALFKQFARAM